jgi:hypothetical protein
MDITVSEACRVLEARGALRRSRRGDAEGVIQQVRERLGGRMPADLEALYREQVASIGDFAAILPEWRERPEWRREGSVGLLLHADAVPIFSDGCGNFYGLDLASGDQRPAVYFFDSEDMFERPHWAAGSSLARFLLLLAEHDQALDEGRLPGWELSIDPDIDKCPRAPAIWHPG